MTKPPDPILPPAPTPATFDSGLYHGSGRETEGTKVINARAMTIRARREVAAVGKKGRLLDLVPNPPRHGEQIHAISPGDFDYWTWIPQMLEWFGRRPTDGYFSTWTMNANNVRELLELIDRGTIATAAVLTGLYFKRRESAVYAQLITGLESRKMRYRAFRNHAKVTLLHPRGTRDYITVEGSANFTANPRLEQYCITNDRGLHDFHREWMETALETEPTYQTE